MPYVEATTLESLRMFMGRGFAVPHRAVKDTTLGGYFIPKVRKNNYAGTCYTDRVCNSQYVYCLIRRTRKYGKLIQ